MTATSSPRTDVSVLGTGSMGAAIARHLVRRGYSVTVWNRTVEKAEPLRDDGAHLAVAPAQALLASPVSITVLMDYDTIVGLVAAGPPLAGRTLVNVTTGEPDDALRLDAAVTHRAGRFLDAALFFYPTEVGGARSSLRLSGSAKAWAEHQSLLRELGGDAVFLGSEVQLANTVDGAWIGFFIPALAAAMEAAAYGSARGVELGDVISSMRTVLPVLDNFLTEAEVRIRSRTFVADNGLDLYITSLLTVVRPMTASALPAQLARAAVQLMKEIRQARGGDLDFSIIHQELLDRIQPGVSSEPRPVT